MPAILGVATIAILLGLILGKRMTPLAALIAVPVATALAGGSGLKTAAFMVHGIQSVAAVAGMFIFAILYFGVMTDAGMLDPIVDKILSMAASSPPRIVVGTALLALLVHLDGSGAVTFLVTIPVMLPLSNRLGGMDRRILACAASMAAGVNFLPWTGPMLAGIGITKAARGLHIQPAGPRPSGWIDVRVRLRMATGQTRREAPGPEPSWMRRGLSTGVGSGAVRAPPAGTRLD